MRSSTIVVKAIWDEEARVRVAESPDLPGLILEAPSQEKLLAKLQRAVPELTGAVA